MAFVEMNLFGMPRIQCDGVLVEFERRKALALIVYLALNNQPYSRDTLAELLWPESNAAKSRASLRRVLSTLGETPLAAWVEAARETVTFNQAGVLWIDVPLYIPVLQ